MEIKRQSIITCPHCGFEKMEAMPVDACTWSWECPQCHKSINPKQGDCCVFCSYGSVPCPTVQHTGSSRACN